MAENEDGQLIDATSEKPDNGPRARDAIRAATERRIANPPPTLGSPDPAPAPSPARSESPSEPARREESPSPQAAAADSVPGARQPRLVSVLAEKAEAPAPSKVPEAATPDDAEAKARRWLDMHGGNATAAHAKALDDNNRMADLARRNQELEAQVAGRAPTTEPGAPPPEPAITEEELNAAVRLKETEDQQCLTWQNEFHQNAQRLNDLLKREDGGGELVKLSRQIIAINANLDPKAFGLDDQQELDEVTRADMERKRETALSKQERLLNERARLETRQANLDAWYTQRSNQFRGEILNQHRQAEAAKAGEVVRASSETEFKGAWASAFKQVAEGYSKEDALYLEKSLLRAADVEFNNGGDIETAQLIDWMKRHEGEVRGFRDRAAGHAAAATAVQKDRHTEQPAPNGAAARAPESAMTPQANSSARDRRRAAERQAALRSRSIAVR